MSGEDRLDSRQTDSYASALDDFTRQYFFRIGLTHRRVPELKMLSAKLSQHAIKFSTFRSIGLFFL